MFVRTAVTGDGTAQFGDLAQRLHFRSFAIFDGGGVNYRISGVEPSVPLFTAKILARFQRSSPAGTVKFGHVMKDARGRPTIHLSQNLGNGRFAIASIGTDYFEQLQKPVVFGRKGHAAIVDHDGNLIAHPSPKWVTRNIASLGPVKRMMAGETGTAEFYSPAVKSDMVTGFTTVASAGWGVMVPQPRDELLAQAKQIRRTVMAFTAIGLVVAALAGWLLAGFLWRPIDQLAASIRAFANGRKPSPGLHVNKYSPAEHRALNDGLRALTASAARRRRNQTVIHDYPRASNDR